MRPVGRFLFCRVKVNAYSPRMPKHSFFPFALTLAFAVSLSADNWPSWRGPNVNGSAAGGTYPVKLTDEAKWAWRVALG